MSSAERASRRVPVLIVGGGPVGLALASELGWRGIRCELIEQTDGAIATPKMNEVNIRSMEICRRWGIARDVSNCPFPADFPLDVAFVTSLAGHELGRIPRAPRAEQKAEPHSPERLQACSQMWFDPILRRFAGAFPHVTLSYRRRLASFAATERSVLATIIDAETGEGEQIEAEYLVGCDGAGSIVRRELGIALEGETLGHPVHLYFRAPGLLERCGRAPAVFFLAIDRAGLWANVRIIDPANAMWRLMVLDAGDGLTPASVDREAYLRRAIGHELAVEWLGTSVWTRRSAVAAQYGVGRVLLAGDAVHQLSPTGALGMNTGIADAVDLGWKLAAVLQGWGGGALLSSYQHERRAIGQRNVAMAAEFYLAHEEFADEIAQIDAEGERSAALRQRVGAALVQRVGRMFRTVGLQIGYRYEDSPICLPDGTPPDLDDPEAFVPSARPGSRAPHCWVDDGRSILDLFGKGFVLLRLDRGAPDGSTLAAAAADHGVPVTAITIPHSGVMELYQRPLVLVRPDGHVAWRGDKLENANLIINTVRGAV